MTQTLALEQIRVAVTESSQPAAARRAAVLLAQAGGMSEPTLGNVALVVTELATNLVKHAKGGELLIRPLTAPDGEACGIEVLALDVGPTRDLTRPEDVVVENFPYLWRSG